MVMSNFKSIKYNYINICNLLNLIKRFNYSKINVLNLLSEQACKVFHKTNYSEK